MNQPSYLLFAMLILLRNPVRIEGESPSVLTPRRGSVTDRDLSRSMSRTKSKQTTLCE